MGGEGRGEGIHFSSSFGIGAEKVERRIGIRCRGESNDFLDVGCDGEVTQNEKEGERAVQKVVSHQITVRKFTEEPDGLKRELSNNLSIKAGEYKKKRKKH